MDFLSQFWLNQWAWFLAAIVLLVLETMAPGVIFLWMAIAAGAVGLIDLVIPGISWEVQVVMFVILSVISVVVGRRYISRNPVPSENETLNRRGEQHIGKTYKVVEAIVGGSGRLKVGDGIWAAEGPDSAPGDLVRVIDVEGTVLKVVPANET